jgi:hypothetical protein
MWCQNACWWFWMSTNGIRDPRLEMQILLIIFNFISVGNYYTWWS